MTTAQPAIALDRARTWQFAGFAAATLPLAIVVPLAWDGGGRRPVAWNVASLALVAVIMTAVLRDRVQWSRIERHWAAVLAALVVWTGLSALWSPDATGSVLDAQRAAMYTLFAVAVAMVVRRDQAALLLGGLLAAITIVCGDALGHRLLPDVLGFAHDRAAGGRLYAPIGYWNGLGGLAAMGVALAAILAAGRSAIWIRGACAATLAITGPTLYLTFSRGALFALAVALGAGLALAPSRLRLSLTLATVAVPVLAVVAAMAHQPALTASDPSLPSVAAAGHRSLAVVLTAALGEGALLVLLAAAERRVPPGRALRRTVAALLVAGAILTAVTVVLAAGGPRRAALRLEHGVLGGPVTRGPSASSRLGDTSLNGRLDMWRVAWQQFSHHPLAGGGAAAFPDAWARARRNADQSDNPHNLYLQAMSELGLVGLAIVLVMLATPLVAAVRLRDDAVALAALAGLLVFAVHSLVDWDWQLAAVGSAAIACGCVLLARGRAQAETRRPRRWLSALPTAVAGAVVAGLLVGNAATDRAAAALQQGRPDAALAAARVASTWMPWSYVPALQSGEAQLAAGNTGQAALAFRQALDRRPSSWLLWLELARASSGDARRTALDRARGLNPHSPEIAVFCRNRPFTAGCRESS